MNATRTNANEKMANERMKRLALAMTEAGIDLLVIPPSGDMNFLIGFNPGGCERFQALFLTRDERLFCVTNRIYEEDMTNALPEKTPVYVWDDAGSFLSAVEEAFTKQELLTAVVGVNEAVRAVDCLALAEKFPGATFCNAHQLISDCRMIKSPQELDLLRQAGVLADEVMDGLKSFIRPGIKERDIKSFILDAFAQKGGLPPSFSPIVASGSNNSRPHYNKDDRCLTKQDVIILDFGCVYQGFCSDTSRTFFIGEPDAHKKEIYAIVKKSFEAAAELIREGARAGEVDAGARRVIEESGYGRYFLNRTGHGIGMDVHEAPFIRGGNQQILQRGMAFSIEPGIYIPGDVGMRIEDIFIINEKGEGESMNHSSKEMIIL